MVRKRHEQGVGGEGELTERKCRHRHYVNTTDFFEIRLSSLKRTLTRQEPLQTLDESYGIVRHGPTELARTIIARPIRDVNVFAKTSPFPQRNRLIRSRIRSTELGETDATIPRRRRRRCSGSIFIKTDYRSLFIQSAWACIFRGENQHETR